MGESFNLNMKYKSESIAFEQRQQIRGAFPFLRLSLVWQT